MKKVINKHVTKGGNIVLERQDGKFFAKLNSIEIVECKPHDKEGNFITVSKPMIGGIMMKTFEDFVWCVENY